MSKKTLWLIFLLGFSTIWAHGSDVSIQGGELDLRGSVISQGIPLVGDWSFRLDQGTGQGSPQTPSLITVPSNWSFPNLPRGLFGSGTYTLKILTHPDQGGLALQIPILGNSYRVLWNGKTIAQAGEPSSLPANYKPGWRPRVVVLEDLLAENTLEIYTANYEDISSGLTVAPVLGPIEELFTKRLHGILFDVLIFGALILMAFYHFGLFLYRRKDKAPLYFGLLSLVLGLRPLLYGGMVFLEVFPQAPYDVYYRLGYLTFALAVTTFVSFLNSLYPSPRLRIISKATAVISLSYSLLILMSPIVFFTSLLGGFQVLTLAAGISSLFFIVKAVLEKKEGSGLLILGFLFFFAGTIVDIVLSLLRLPPLQVVATGLLFFMLFQSLIIAKKFSLAFRASEEFSKHLASLNNSLERFIPKEVLSFLQKKSIVDIVIGDHSEKIMTVMFADIRDFTSLSETMTPQQNFRFINSYLKRVGPHIRQNKGFVDKYMGDGIMALFPETPDDALNAAMGIRAELTQYNLDRAKAGYPAVRVGIGIHTGRLMLGTIGENLRMDSTVISDAVNVAARLETLTKKLSRDILISADTIHNLESTHGFSLTHCGMELIKGKVAPVEVYTLN